MQEKGISGTVVSHATAGVKDFGMRLLEMLVLQQDSMHLHKHVNDVLGLADLDFDAMQYTICEARTFIYASRPRKSAGGFQLSMREAHEAWYLASAWKTCWSTITKPVETLSKKRKRS